MPASRTITPWASCRLGSRPASTSLRMRVMTPKPWIRSRIRTGESACDHQTERRQHADLAADHDEAGDLEQRKSENKQ